MLRSTKKTAPFTLPAVEPVEILTGSTGRIHPTAGRMLDKWDVLELPAAEAAELVGRGQARGFARVRVLADGVFFGSRTYSRGEEDWSPLTGVISELVGLGLVEVLRPAPRSPAETGPKPAG